ncbi:enoyl-CoA hydratase/isomerase family protein [Effusibacillus dendaii]|uniref:Enoyl-CoA hydratase/isomerase domain-containing protein n=1 Tax=Effusibacillus dendaii TaxID=2743772 RepID=A0A7I8DHN2_9BACL|nr:enoyl-CoA hydratase/isomerase family protein [Effusibacillus dendaii]BCJ88426.1 hypothetical protein skT53_34110 [Effusibacillus dendaii]
MGKPLIFAEKKGAIATVFFNRAEKRNALNMEMWTAIPKIMEDLKHDSEVKVVIFRGIDETAFAAGADISEFTTVRSTVEGARLYQTDHCHGPTVLCRGRL